MALNYRALLTNSSFSVSSSCEKNDENVPAHTEPVVQRQYHHSNKINTRAYVLLAIWRTTAQCLRDHRVEALSGPHS
jgi:hypothetical protein